MNPNALRADLADLAEQVAIVDLRDRALTTSRRLAVRRATLAAVALIVAVAGVAVVLRPLSRDIAPSRPVPTHLPATTESTTVPTIIQRPVATDPLANATLDLPAWGGTSDCGPGLATFRNGTHLFPNGGPQALLVKAVPVTVAGQPAEAVALMCLVGNHHSYQVAVFRTDSGSAVGQVVADAAVVFELSSPGPDQVAVELGDRYDDAVPFSDVEKASQHQVRTYLWNGHGFAQSGGPTAFASDPPSMHLEETTTALVFQHGAAGVGRMTVTVRNSGRLAAPRVSLRMYVAALLEPTGSAWAGCTIAHGGQPTQTQPGLVPTDTIVCDLGSLAPGERREIGYEFVMDPVTSSIPDGALCTVMALQRPPYGLETGLSDDPVSAAIVIH
jgi:hypothetical protein